MLTLNKSYLDSKTELQAMRELAEIRWYKSTILIGMYIESNPSCADTDAKILPYLRFLLKFRDKQAKILLG